MSRRYEYWVRPPTEYRLISLGPITSGDPLDFMLPYSTVGLFIGTAGIQDVTFNNDIELDSLQLNLGVNTGFFRALRINPLNTAANIWASVVGLGPGITNPSGPPGIPSPLLPGSSMPDFSLDDFSPDDFN